MVCLSVPVETGVCISIYRRSKIHNPPSVFSRTAGDYRANDSLWFATTTVLLECFCRHPIQHCHRVSWIRNNTPVRYPLKLVVTNQINIKSFDRFEHSTFGFNQVDTPIILLSSIKVNSASNDKVSSRSKEVE